MVLGGGGSTGNAWLIGVVAGLFDAGVDVTKAEVTIGTSAGSTAAAQLSGATPPELYAATLVPIPARPGAPNKPVVDHLERMRKIIAASANPAELRRRIGAAALELDTDDAWSAQWRGMVASRLPRQVWPERKVLITAIDAQNGEPVVFDRQSGVALADAVAASCSSGRPYRVGSRRYLDGGFRSNAENADLAEGSARVLVLAPFGGETLLPLEWGVHLAAQVEALRANGSEVEVIVPTSGELFGVNAMDLSLRPAAARAGYELGTACAERVGLLWR
ncbi:MAG: patatin-like phospholipase family protein [Archangium sp.]